ncbi:hypothetical protein ACF0H5_015369 [Mactra antiquata]
MPRLSEDQRNQAIGMLNAGAIVNDVAQHFGCSLQTIHNLVSRYTATGSVRDRQRPGRERATSRRDDRAITLAHLRNRFLSATVTARQLGVSAQTIRNRLRKSHFPLRARRPYTGPLLTARHRAQRLAWCRRHRLWRRAQWNNVIFSDESRFRVSFADGRVRIYRRKNGRFAQCCVREADRFGGGSVMVWGGIMGNQKTELVVVQGHVNAQGYIDILRNHLLPFMQNHGPQAIFQHDNARPHTARVTTAFLANNNVNVLPWPALSPDLNPIEHIWDEIGRRARNNHQINSIHDLRQALLLEWQAIPNDVIRHYVNSMRRRILACINSNGSHTRY